MKRCGIAILLIFSLFLNLPYIHLREFQGEEGRRVIVAENMLKSGDWIVPHVEGAVYLKKPPFYNWILAGIFYITGIISETTARLSSVITVTTCAIVISLFWRKIAGIRDLWYVLPGLVFLTFPDVMGKAIKAEIDITFTLFVTLSIISFFYFYEFRKKELAAWTISLFLVGIGILTKGVQAPAFFYAGVIPYMIYKREGKKIISISHLAGICVLLIVILMWLIPLLNITGYDKLIHTSLNEITARREPMKEGSFFKHLITFPLQYFISYSPWILFLVLWLYKPLEKLPPLMKSLAVYCLFFLIFSIPFYWIMPGAWLRYVLPLAGPLAILITLPLYSLITTENTHREVSLNIFHRYLQLLGLLIILLTLSSPFWGKRLNLGGNLLSIILLCITFITSLILMLLKSNVRTRLSILLVMVLFAKLSWASLYFPYHSDHLSHYRNAANRINEAATLDVMLYDYGVDNPHLAYYLNRPLKLITSVDEAMNEKGAVIFMKKKTAEGLQTNNLSYMGEVKARIETLVLYRVK
ncbi:MAG: glycosyltransferase family 39 protein [Nitrospirota bacterium]